MIEEVKKEEKEEKEEQEKKDKPVKKKIDAFINIANSVGSFLSLLTASLKDFAAKMLIVLK